MESFEGIDQGYKLLMVSPHDVNNVLAATEVVREYKANITLLAIHHPR
eukprot:CAMPEP_0113511146 /NCGR_PEP_ID=MMETSP0014_2-20120614/38540_1 /TAXON_ID=2857 /ORGANISM="Nitzschia sp." /LENGTH=47 /DNA_ID=CAMNT_0000407197 /DNA_START=505 /DNA_END=648 /DNA_ORIENTATION=+ /assembly_acc=CAM_ASM_000159